MNKQAQSKPAKPDDDKTSKVAEILAMRSVVYENQPYPFEGKGMTVLDAAVACRMLDNPPEPNEALRELLALR